MNKKILSIQMVVLTALLVPAAFAYSAARADEGALKENTMGRSGNVATLGGGCFWCLEAVYERIEGVNSVISGYAGGTTVDPTYEEVCSGRTGHAEVVRIEYDPERISYEEILDIFWKAHDPTTLNRQGADTGTQYRSIILYHDEMQKRAAEKSIKKAGPLFDGPIVTELRPIERFYPAEEYHQDYFDRNRLAGYCMIVIQPKLKKMNLL
jgi:peptide-methionine (S)-S-oxide reductase